MSIARLMQMARSGVPSAADGWDLSNASYLQSLSVAANADNPRAVFFKPDGTKMYISSDANDAVVEYDLNTAWDISTASYLQSLSVSDPSPRTAFFKPDGTKMFFLSASSDVVREYDLSTAWDISTASYSQQFSVNAQDSFPVGLSFKTDGTKMFYMGNQNDSVFEYDLSTAWDISTVSYSQSFSVSSQDDQPQEVFFKPDGTKMFFIGNRNDSVYEYDLSTAWDVSTASYVQSFSVTSQETNVRGLSFKPDGTKMYICGNDTDAVYEYDL